jgi:hypothetical protein
MKEGHEHRKCDDLAGVPPFVAEAHGPKVVSAHGKFTVLESQ